MNYNNPYYGNYNGYLSNQYYNAGQNMQMPSQLPMNQNFRTFGLQGKQIDNLDVVKATDIPLDGSVSYFPLANGEAIATKQLMQDGTSKITIYRPSTDEKEEEKPKYVTENDLKAQIKDFNGKDIKDIKEEIKTIKRQIEDITDDIKDKKEK